MKDTCDRCGQPHPRCNGHNRQGLPCGRGPATNQQVCVLHGGAAPQAIAAAERRAQDRAALRAAETFGLPIPIDAPSALLEELHRTAGEVAWLGAIVADLDEHEAVWGITREKTGDDAGTTREAQPNVWIRLWHQQRRHLVDVSRECVRAGIEERRIRLAESQGALLGEAVRRILDRLGLTDDQLQLVTVVVPEELRRVATYELTSGATA